MALLEKKLQEEIDNLAELAYEKFENNYHDESFIIMEQTWNLYPEPKENRNEAYNTAKYICDDCFSIMVL